MSKRMIVDGCMGPGEIVVPDCSPCPSSDPFYAIVQEICVLHDKKAKDYGLGADILANIRASEDFGVPAWVGAVLRGNDKMTRIKSFIQKGNLANESLEDSLLDLAVYAIIALELRREQTNAVSS